MIKGTVALGALMLVLSSCRAEPPTSSSSPISDSEAEAKQQCEQSGNEWKPYGEGWCVEAKDSQTSAYKDSQTSAYKVDPNWDPDKARKKAQAVRNQAKKGSGNETKEEETKNDASSPMHCDTNLPKEQFDSCLEDLADKGGYTGVARNAYIVSYQVCSVFSPDEVAAEYGSASDPISAAEAYSQDFRPEAQQASFEGCLAAFDGPS